MNEPVIPNILFEIITEKFHTIQDPLLHTRIAVHIYPVGDLTEEEKMKEAAIHYLVMRGDINRLDLGKFLVKLGERVMEGKRS